jgi:hypothetical protein
MKKLFFVLIITGICSSIFAQLNGLGLGVILGEPTGLSAKMWTSKTTAIDGAAAWSLAGDGYIHLHADVLVHSFAIKVDKGELPIYIGLGARILLADNPGVGVRVPLGIAYHFASAPFDAFLEIAPILDLLPATGYSTNGAIGLRYYF